MTIENYVSLKYNFLNDIMKSPKNLIIYGLGNIRILEMLEQLYIIE